MLLLLLTGLLYPSQSRMLTNKEVIDTIFFGPIRKKNHEVSCFLYFDDNNVIHLNLDKDETTGETHHALQCSIDRWIQLLMKLE